MLFGSREEFAVECFHEPAFANNRGWVFGRMCVWARGIELGNLSEPACMLNVTEAHFEHCLAGLDDLHDPLVDDLSDDLAFQFLDVALYLDDDRTVQQVAADACRFSKFNFLINEGESFDGIKAFLLKSGAHFRILFRLPCDSFGSAEVKRDSLVNAMLGFQNWMAAEKRAVPTR